MDNEEKEGKIANNSRLRSDESSIGSVGRHFGG